MSPFALLSTAVAIPLAVVILAFLGFYLYAQLTELTRRIIRKKRSRNKPGSFNQLSSIPATNLSSIASVSPDGLTFLASPYDTSVNHSALSFQPISYFLSHASTVTIPESPYVQFDLKDIPGINESHQLELYELGYTSVEQIARWGRADVRAVSALLEVDQQKIEEEWVAGARFILSIR